MPHGLVSARLVQPVGGGIVVAVTACQATSATAELTLDQVVELRDKLGDLLRRAGR